MLHQLRGVGPNLLLDRRERLSRAMPAYSIATHSAGFAPLILAGLPTDVATAAAMAAAVQLARN